MSRDDMLSRGLRLLTVLADQPSGSGVSALARTAGLPVSTTHRLLALLADDRFVSYDPGTRRYALGVRVLELLRGFHDSPEGFAPALDPLRRLADRTGLPAIAGVLDGEDVLLVLTAPGNQHLQLRSAVGMRNPWHATALGKALAAAQPEADLRRRLARPLRAPTVRTLTDPDALRADLDAVRARGWAAAEEENEVGVRSIAVAVPARQGAPARLAVSLAAASVLTGPEELRAHVPLLEACAHEVAARLR